MNKESYVAKKADVGNHGFTKKVKTGEKIKRKAIF